jgi:hypothetical protein
MTINNYLFKKSVSQSILRVICLLLLSCQSYADLTSLSDNALSDEILGSVSGQALFKIEENPSSFAGQEDISFTKMTLGLKIEMNVIIDELSLGTFHREGGDAGTCDGPGRSCANNNPATNFNTWRCNEIICGGIYDDGEGNPFSASALVYGDLIGLSNAQKFGAAFAALFGDHYASSAAFTREDIFPAGFEDRKEGSWTETDILLRDMTFGRVVENADGSESLEDFIIEKPFVEFAHDDSDIINGGVRKIAGLRIGFGSSTGVQGQAIDAVSGFIRPVVDVYVDAGIAGQAEFTFAPYLGGVRTAGYINVDPTKTLVSPCDGSGLVCGQVEDADKIATASPQAQLFPLQNLVLDESPSVWISMQSKDIIYESDTKLDTNGTDTIKYDYETAKAGFWFNLGALNITKNNQQVLELDPGSTNYTKASLVEFNRLSGIQGDTSKPLHPDNYFSAHPNSGKYTQANNYY